MDVALCQGFPRRTDSGKNLSGYCSRVQTTFPRADSRAFEAHTLRCPTLSKRAPDLPGLLSKSTNTNSCPQASGNRTRSYRFQGGRTSSILTRLVFELVLAGAGGFEPLSLSTPLVFKTSAGPFQLQLPGYRKPPTWRIVGGYNLEKGD